VDVELPGDLFADGDQLTGSEIERIKKYLELQPNTKQGEYVIIVETSDGNRQILGTFIIGKEKIPEANNPEAPPPEEDSKEENAGKPSNPNDQSLYLDPRNPKTSVALDSSLQQESDRAWSLMLGSLWLVRKPNDSSQTNNDSTADYTLRARRIRRLSSLENTQGQSVPNDTASE
ncbi:MAG: hypothetical protein ACKOOI_19715, partial [Pirellula sp.]